MAKNEKRVKVTLACEVCKRRNYITMKNKQNDRERIEMKKYCRFDRQHTLAQGNALNGEADDLAPLVELARNGDRAAFEQPRARHLGRLLRPGAAAGGQRARRPRRPPGGLPARLPLAAQIPRRLRLRDLVAPHHGQLLGHLRGQASQELARRARRRPRGARDERREGSGDRGRHGGRPTSASSRRSRAFPTRCAWSSC